MLKIKNIWYGKTRPIITFILSTIVIYTLFQFIATFYMEPKNRLELFSIVIIIFIFLFIYSIIIWRNFSRFVNIWANVGKAYIVLSTLVLAPLNITVFTLFINESDIYFPILCWLVLICFFVYYRNVNKSHPVIIESTNNLDEENDFYALALAEIEENKFIKPLYAKALELSEGNKLKLQAIYIKLRVHNLKQLNN